MRSRVPLLMCAFAAVVELASAQSIALNGVAAPAGVTVGAATSVTLGVADSAGQPSDYLALFAIGAPDSQPLAWCYLNGTKTAPGTGLTTATVTQLAPGAAGTYEWRLFTNSTRLATSGPVTVTASTAVVTVTRRQSDVAHGRPVDGRHYPRDDRHRHRCGIGRRTSALWGTECECERRGRQLQCAAAVGAEHDSSRGS